MEIIVTIIDNGTILHMENNDNFENNEHSFTKIISGLL